MAGRIPTQFIDQLLDRVDIVDLINSRIPLKKAGKDYQACCPFHDEKTPSFTVSREKQFYHCFGCGAHGTAIGFLMEYDNLGFVEAVEELAARQGLEVPREGGDSGPDLRPLYGILEQAAQFYRQALRDDPAASRAVDYLKRRGLSGEIAARFGIGFAPPGNRLMQRLGSDPEALQRLWVTGMLSEAEDGRRYDRFRERIMFPIRNHRGQVIGFGGRLLGDGKPKYLNSPETPLFHKGRELYGLYEARKAVRRLERLLVVEGYMDVVALAQFGIDDCVATLGTATTPEHMERLFRTVPELVFCFDGDRAGREAGWKALETALPAMKDGREVRFLFLPEGEDPDSLVRREGADAFRQRLDDATPLARFLFERLGAEVDMESESGRARLVELARPLLQRLPAGVFRQLMFQRLNELVGVDVVEQGRTGTTRPGRRRLPAGSSLGTMPPVRRAIALLITNPHFASRDPLPSGWEKSPRPGIGLLQELLDLLRSQPNLTTASLLERWRERDEGRHLGRLAATPLPLAAEQLEQEFHDTLEALAREAVDEEWEALTRKARQGLSEAEKSRLNQLLREKAERDRQSQSENDG
ncbi:MAG TPA: DNA primase [Sedimenticola thiotaurini]|uniref:DNA primase n=1 Tax=Sedimenticola thiotaurini TaxID=1543721 RepID=A0A831RLY4_9GAMM|nr:DNA primase [Sedimenticola thiotaurini]